MDEAAKRLGKHLVMRRALDLNNIGSKLATDEINMSYTPVSVLGMNRKDDNKLVLFEFPGKIDIPGVMLSVRKSQYMDQRFKIMENLMERLLDVEKRTGKRSGVILVFDLEGLVMDSSLISVATGLSIFHPINQLLCMLIIYCIWCPIEGPFRIMWSIVFNMYPEWIHKFIIVNTPTFMSVLWSAFSQFIPENTKVL